MEPGRVQPDEGQAAPVEGQGPVDPDLTPGRGLAASTLAAIFVGGVIGGLARYGLTQVWPAPARGFPWVILVVNASGAFALPLVVLAAGRGRSLLLRPFFGTGVLGAWTTFGAVAVSSDELMAHGRPALGVGYLVATTVAGLLAAAGGFAVGRRVLRW